MNFLALAQKAAVECGVASTTAITVALPTVVGASGSLGRIVGWVADGWNDLQCAQDDWDWMRSSNLLGAGVSFATVAAQASYPLGTGAGTVGVAVDAFGKWDRETFRCFTTSVGIRDEIEMNDLTFDAWRDGYMRGAQRTVQTRPYVAAVGPDQSICLGPPPNSLYTITADYFMAPSIMVADADVPTGLPTRFHLDIVYRAMMKYGGYLSAPDAYARGSEEHTRVYNLLLAARGVRMSLGGALA